LRKSRIRIAQGARARLAAFAVSSILALEPLSSCAQHSYLLRESEIAGLVRGQAEEADAKRAIDAMGRYGDRESAAAADMVPRLYGRAGALARTLGMGEDSSTRLNLAYGIAVLGEDGAARLHREMGLRYFMRYSAGMLRAALSDLDGGRQAKPVLAIGFNESDYNGAFYREGLSLDPLLRGYRVVLFEADGEKGFYSALGRIAAREGSISALVIGGHGNPGAITLGGGGEQGEIDKSDAAELSALRKDFVPRPVVVLISCSTGADGNAVGAVISRALDARLYAPVKPSSKTVYHLDAEGRIASVSYDVQTRNFVGGVAR
jgi:hypothetical protein